MRFIGRLVSFVVFVILLCVGFFSFGQSKQVDVVIPTAEDEANYIWQNIKDVVFFDRNGYSVTFPRLIYVDSLLNLSRKNQLNESDYNELEKRLADSIYSINDYSKGFDKIQNGISTIEYAITQLSNQEWGWDFQFFSYYTIKLTLYGPGGSYNNETGVIVLQAYPNGKFKGYNSQINTVIHEIVHIGLEKSIIRRYKLSHTQKERLVDLFVSIFFGDLLPDYKVQEFGDKRLDKYFSKKNDFQELPSRIEQFLKENS